MHEAKVAVFAVDSALSENDHLLAPAEALDGHCPLFEGKIGNPWQ